MTDLPYVYQGFEVPTEQSVAPCVPADYVGVQVIRGTDSWIVVELVRRHLAFGTIERWQPIFECAIPAGLMDALNLKHQDERYFNIRFRGTPSEKGRYGSSGLSIREVRIAQVSEIREGRVPPYES